MKSMRESEYKKYLNKTPPKHRERVLILSDHGGYTIARECFPVFGKKEAQLKWIKEHKLLVSSNDRVFAEYQNFIVDAVTGSLYKNGQCLGSAALTATGLTDDPQKAKKLLLGLHYKIEQNDGSAENTSLT